LASQVSVQTREGDGLVLPWTGPVASVGRNESLVLVLCLSSLATRPVQDWNFAPSGVALQP
jgi:hypothetical protein